MREFKADLPHSLCECEWEWEASVDPQSPGRKRQTRYKSRLQVAEYNMQYQARALTVRLGKPDVFESSQRGA